MNDWLALRHAEIDARTAMLDAERAMYANIHSEHDTKLKADFASKERVWIAADAAFVVAVANMDVTVKTLTAQLAAAQSTIAELIGGIK